MNQKDEFDIFFEKTYFDDEQSINYKTFINCLVDIIKKKCENKDIDKNLIEE